MAFRLVLPAVLLALVAAQGELVVVKEGLYHRPGCEVIRDATDVLAMSRGQADSRGFKSHPACDPAVAPTPEPDVKGAPAAKPRAKAAPIFVFVDAAGKLYHRETCTRLGKTPTRVELDATLAKKYWPCGTCRAPILPRKNKKPWTA